MNRGFEVIGSGCPMRDAMPKEQGGEFEKVVERRVLNTIIFGDTLNIFIALEEAHSTDMQALRDQLKQSTALIDAQREKILKLQATLERSDNYLKFEQDQKRIAELEAENAALKESIENYAAGGDCAHICDSVAELVRKIAELETQVPKVVRPTITTNSKGEITAYCICTVGDYGDHPVVGRYEPKIPHRTFQDLACRHCGAKLDWSEVAP